MTIIVNGKQETVPENLPLSGLLAQKKIDPAHIVIEYNGAILGTDTVSGVTLTENDILEILHFVGGG